MLDGWHKDWHLDADHESNEDGVRGWVEHMDAGGFPVGTPQSERQNPNVADTQHLG